MESQPLSKESFESDSDRPWPSDWQKKPDRQTLCILSRGLTSWISWVLVGSVVLNLFLVGTTIWTASSTRWQGQDSASGDFSILTSFDEEDLRYQSLDLQYDELWNARLSEANSTGILRLPDSQHTDGIESLGGLAMFHQLHCLYVIRNDVRKAVSGEDISKNWVDAGHGNHCLDYLRKAVLCYADPTVERPTIPKDDGLGAIALDITGHERRMCRDSETLHKIREDKMVHDFSEYIENIKSMSN